MRDGDHLLDYLQEEPDEDIRLRRRELMNRLPEEMRMAMEKIIEELADELTLNHKRSESNTSGLSNNELLEAYLEEEKRKKSKAAAKNRFAKKPREGLLEAFGDLREESFRRIRALIAPLPLEPDDKELIVKEVVQRAFRLAVHRSDRAYFLMRQNY